MFNKATYVMKFVLILSFFIYQDISAQETIKRNNDLIKITSEGIAFLGSGISESVAKTLAFQDAKAKALENAGTYFEANTTLLNDNYNRKFLSLAGFFRKIKIIKENKEIIEGMFAIRSIIEATISINELNRNIDLMLKNNDMKKKLVDLEEKKTELENNIFAMIKSGNTGLIQESLNIVDADVWDTRANIEFNESNFNLAIEYASNAILLNPENDSPYFTRGRAYCSIDSFYSAIKDFSKMIEINDDFLIYYMTRCDAYAHTKEYSKGVIDLTKALDLLGRDDSPDNLFYNNLFIKRGFLYYLQCDYINSIDDFSKALDIKPDYEIYFYRGISFFHLNQMTNALHDFDESIILNPHYIYSYLFRGNILREIGNVERSIKDLNKVDTFSTDNPEIHYHFSCYYSLFNQTSKALFHLEQAFKYGYEDFDSVESDDDLLNIRNNPDYAKILKKYKK